MVIYKLGMEIKPISIPPSIIRAIPPPVTNITPPPVTSTIEVPVIDVPTPIIEYPTLDVPTQQNFEGMITPPRETQEETPEDTRDLPAPVKPVVDKPTVNVPGVGEVELPPVAPLITAGATAVVVATVTMGSTVLLNMLKDKFLGPLLDKMTKPKKVKIKQKKPVLHFVDAEDGVSIFEYSVKGTRLVQTVDNIEQYLRDQVDMDSLYEFDNKIIIDDVIKDKMTKDGAKRFGKHFTPAKAIVKKLSAKLSL